MRQGLFGVVNSLVLIAFLCLALTINHAEELSEKETNVGIQFEKGQSQSKDDIKPPLIDGGDNRRPIRMLPETGELLTSLIIILLGISCFIFSIGVFFIKQLYQRTSWEG